MSTEYYASPARETEIEQKAYAWRETLDIGFDVLSPDMVSVLELKLPKILPEFYLIVKDNTEYGVEAYTEFDPPRITATTDVYNGAVIFDGRSRMTLAHELGHLVLHKKAVPLNRAPSQYQALKKLPSYCSAEWQANTFASYFLLPEAVIRDYDSVEDVVTFCNVSRSAATVRFKKLEGKHGKRVHPDVLDALKVLRNEGA